MLDTTNTLIVDDHALLAGALAEVLRKHEPFHVEVLTSYMAARERLKGTSKVDIVLLDLVMPDMPGMIGVSDLVKLAADSKVVLLSGHLNSRIVESALASGCAGFIPKTFSIKSIESALNLILSGQIFVPESYMGFYDDATREYSKQDKLILNLISQGLGNKEIAYKLKLSEVTVKARLRTIFTKLGAKNRASAIALAVSLGVITIDHL